MTTVDSLNDDQLAEIAALRKSLKQTARMTVPALEQLLYEPLPVLDHGFVRVVDYMGGDSAIVQAARVSYGRGTRTRSDDRSLIRYLMSHRHTSPFEMCEIKLHIKLPIFVARQWIRHRTANVNEYSARYSILDREFYIPEPDAIRQQAEYNKQGRGALIPTEEARRVQLLLRSDAERAYRHYEELLNESHDEHSEGSDRGGLARELARMNLSLNFYTQWYWKIDLHNLLHFLALRSDIHAQLEMRLYAREILDRIVKVWVPMTYEAFQDYRVGSQTLSAQAMRVVRSLVDGRRQEAEAMRVEAGVSSREWRELMQALGLDE